MLNWLFLGLILVATVTGALAGTMGEVSAQSIAMAKTAVDISISLIGQMALWLGVFQILQDAGMMGAIARALKPVMSRLFPDIPEDHPALGAMIMNIAANMMGLTNAATPFGIKAMIELNKLNDRPGVATNAMCLFLTINTSGVAVLPTGAIAVRAAMGADNATGIFFPTILATMCSTVVGIIVAKTLQNLGFFAADKYGDVEAGEVKDAADIKGLGDAEKLASETTHSHPVRLILAMLVVGVLAFGLGSEVNRQVATESVLDVIKVLSADWILPILLVAILLVGFVKKIRVYESVVRGAKQGFEVGVMVIPFLVAILVAIGMFRGSGAMEWIVSGLTPILGPLGFPPEALPMAIIRPLSGSGALGVVTETMKTTGPNSFASFVVSTMSGSTETTFYVLAVYFGAIGVRASRYTVLSCLAADLTGITAAVALSHVFF
ncbi:MAG: nucleoside recognition domain-containing protein [Deltaproteobacteria bacterium]